jgi:hypothetical protein
MKDDDKKILSFEEALLKKGLKKELQKIENEEPEVSLDITSEIEKRTLQVKIFREISNQFIFMESKISYLNKKVEVLTWLTIILYVSFFLLLGFFFSIRA